MENSELQTSVYKFGNKISIITAILTMMTFAIAILTPPLSGPFCKADCFQYPFTDIISRFPRDYYWMYFAMVLMLFYLSMLITVHQTVANEKKHFGLIGVSFAIMASLVLFSDYFIQVSVIQPSLLAGETDGISILSQFNPHGIFIVLEEIGFLFMVISIFFFIPTFTDNNANQKAIKWTAIIGLTLTILSFLFITLIHGINREYRFEVAVISITWIELIIISFLYARYFKNKLRE
jgi:hypothetical protein